MRAIVLPCLGGPCGILVIATLLLSPSAFGRDEVPPAVRLNPTPQLRLKLDGPVGAYLEAVTRNWLIPAPRANPAILAMFADRDRTPYRDLLPWSGEFAGKYLTGATQVLDTTGDPALRTRLEGFVRALVPLQDADGYLGPFPPGHRLTGKAPNIGGKPGDTWDAWGHYHMILGLLLWHEASGDAAALAGARRIGDLLCDRFLGDKRPRLVDTGSTEMNLAPAHALCLLHEKTGEARYLALARQLVAEFAAVDAQGRPLAGDYYHRGEAGEPFYRLPKPRWESLHPVLALAELARIEPDPQARSRYAQAFTNLWWSIARLDRHNNGGFSSGEQAQGNPYHRGAIETCCTIAWMAMTVEMLRLTGNPIAADELELSTFNSALGLFSPSGRWSTYNTPMDGDRKANFHEIVFQARPGSPELNCCSVNAARGLGLLSQWALMSDEKKEALVLNWYGPGTLAATVHAGSPSAEVPVRLVMETDYPRSGRVQITVHPERAAAFPIRLRIPHWSSRTRVAVGGEPVADIRPAHYLELRRSWNPGDTITLDLDLTPHAWSGERESAGRVSLFRGPILLAYDRRFNSQTGSGDDPGPLDLAKANLAVKEKEAAGGEGQGPTPIVLVEAQTENGPIVLCDFASAGADGSTYRTWLRGGPIGLSPIGFSREHPLRSRPLTAPPGR